MTIENDRQTSGFSSHLLFSEIERLKKSIWFYFNQHMNCFDRESKAYIEIKRETQQLHEKICDAQYFLNNEITFPTVFEYLNEGMSYTSNIYALSKKHSEHKDTIIIYATLLQQAMTKYLDKLERFILYSEDERFKYDQQTDALRYQLAHLMLNKNAHSKFVDMLKKIPSMIEKHEPVTCYISYSWPTEDRINRDSWIQPFLMILHDHLLAAGLKPVLDIKDNLSNESIFNLPEQMNLYEYVLLIGTPSLREKHRDPYWRFEKLEMSIVHQKQGSDQKEYMQRIIPIRISGTPDECFLPHHNTFMAISDWREISYPVNLQNIIRCIYFGNLAPVRYDQLWNNFFAEYIDYSSCLNISNLKDSRAFEYYYNSLYADLLQSSWYPRLLRQHRADHAKPEVLDEYGQDQHNDTSFGRFFQIEPPDDNYVIRSKAEYELNRFAQQNYLRNERAVLLINGVHATGKTQLIRTFIEKQKYSNESIYSSVIWLHVNSSVQENTYGTLHQQLLVLSEKLGIRISTSSNNSEPYDPLFEKLSIRGKYLIIYDDVNKLREIKKYLPSSSINNCHIIITTINNKSRDFGSELSKYKLSLSSFTLHEAKSYVSKYIKLTIPEQQVRMFCELHGCHPGALTSALQLISNRNIDIMQYIMRGGESGVDSDYQTLQNSYSKLLLIDSLPENSKKLLNLFSCFDKDTPIDISLIDNNLKRNLPDLRQYSLVIDDTRLDHFHLSPWIKILVNKSIDLTTQYHLHRQVAIAIIQQFSSRKISSTDLDKARILVNHINYLIMHLKKLCNLLELPVVFELFELQDCLTNAYLIQGNLELSKKSQISLINETIRIINYREKSLSINSSRFFVADHSDKLLTNATIDKISTNNFDALNERLLHNNHNFHNLFFIAKDYISIGLPCIAIEILNYLISEEFSRKKCYLLKVLCYISMGNTNLMIHALKSFISSSEIIDMQIFNESKISDDSGFYTTYIMNSPDIADLSPQEIFNFVDIFKRSHQYNTMLALLTLLHNKNLSKKMRSATYYQLSICYCRLQDFDKALTSIEKSLTIFPNEKSSIQKQKLLKTIEYKALAHQVILTLRTRDANLDLDDIHSDTDTISDLPI